METIEAVKVDSKIICLKSNTDLEKVYKLIEDNVNFVLNWTDGKNKCGKVIFSCNLFPQIKNGEVELIFTEDKTK